MSKPALRSWIALTAATAWLLLWPGLPAGAQDLSFEVRGQKVKLAVADDLVLVRPRGRPKALDLAAAAITAQAKLLAKDVGPPAWHLAGKPPRSISQLGGYLVPRLAGLKNAQVSRIAALSDQIATCEMVYRAKDQVVTAEGTVTVRFRRPPQARALFAITSELGLKETARPQYASHVVRYEATAPNADLSTVCAKLRQMGVVRWAEPDLVFELLLCDGPKLPNDPHFQRQWYLQPGESAIQVPEAWAVSQGTDKITVAVMDDGVDLHHKELQGKLVDGFDFYHGDPDSQPDRKSAHGTACAGIIGAIGDNSQGIAGIAWHAKIMPIRICGDESFASSASIAEAFHFCAQHGAKVISCSWGGKSPSNQIIDSIDAASDAGCLVVVAAGNASPADYTFYPARYEMCMAIGALKRDNTLWDYSCWGPGRTVDLVAPSGACNLEGDVWSTDHSGSNGYNSGGSGAEEPTGDYTAHFGGTSAATPVVAGVAALVWSTFPELTAADVRQVLQETATKVDPDGGEWINGRSGAYGYGKVNALAALKRAEQVMIEKNRARYIKSGTKPSD